MTIPNDPRERLVALMNACAESIETMTDDELLQEANAVGVDASTEASRVRGLLLGAFVRAKKSELADATREHQEVMSTLSRRKLRIPAVASERRAMLMQEIERRPQMKDAIAALQSRDLPTFSDTEVEKVLEQLEALGLLDDEDSDTRS